MKRRRQGWPPNSSAKRADSHARTIERGPSANKNSEADPLKEPTTMKPPIPAAALAQHIAFLGKTGSGKTSTAKLAVEQIVADDPGARICILDPIKSDWWGLTSSASGKRAGLPFHILGGPRGHVPLHDSAGKAIGELVGSGALPLSIIDMADFAAGGLQRFFNDFAPALLRRMRGVVYLVLEEAHEFAPKERAGHEGENMTLHFAKRLATAGRSKGIRLMVLTQRTQALHNALLGSCDTMIAHRLTAPADQKPVKDWLKANVSEEIFEKVSASLAGLRTGSGWICSGEAQVAEMVAFPKIATYDNSATPTGNGQDLAITTAPVDRDKLRAIMGDAAKEAEASHIPTLQKRIRELEAEVAKKPAPVAATPPVTINAKSEQITAAYDRGVKAAERSRHRQAKDVRRTVDSAAGKVANIIAALEDFKAGLVEIGNMMDLVPAPIEAAPAAPSPSPVVRAVVRDTVRAMERAAVMPAEGLTGPMQRILDALAWWRAVGVEQPARVQVAAVARYSATSSSFANPLSALRTAGLIDYPNGGTIALTAEGAGRARAPDASPTTPELHARVFEILNGPRRRILEPLLAAYPEPMAREALAEASRYSATSSSFANPLSSLRSLGLIDYRPGGQVVALPVLFVE